MLFGYLYTGGPIPIAYTPFGEIFSGFFMGTVIIGISFYIQTEVVTGELLLLTIPIAVLIGAILLSNNIRDLEGDKKHGRKTLAILVGRDQCDSRTCWVFHRRLLMRHYFYGDRHDANLGSDCLSQCEKSI